MTTKKSGAAKSAGGTEKTQKQLNELYTAHQVHTLAHLLYQQIAARRSGGQPWTNGIAQPMDGCPGTPGWMGSAQGAPRPLMYWYP